VGHPSLRWAAEADELAQALQTIDYSRITQGGGILASAALALFSHAQHLELPYGPLLGYGWAKGTPYYVPPGHEYPCPEIDASAWTYLLKAHHV
jgi:hypothetical protein